jgi:hypothetical protein
MSTCSNNESSICTFCHPKTAPARYIPLTSNLCYCFSNSPLFLPSLPLTVSASTSASVSYPNCVYSISASVSCSFRSLIDTASVSASATFPPELHPLSSILLPHPLLCLPIQFRFRFRLHLVSLSPPLLPSISPLFLLFYPCFFFYCFHIQCYLRIRKFILHKQLELGIITL